MAGSRSRWVRSLWLLLAVGVALAALLALAPPAGAAKYLVAQCGWGIGSDARWLDSTGGRGFQGEASCTPPGRLGQPGGARLESRVRPHTGSVAGGELARWRWTAPAGTAITAARGLWWHSLKGSFVHRLGSAGEGVFTILSEARTSSGARAFAARFARPGASFESRLLCARLAGRCAADPPSFAALRSLVLTLEDHARPAARAGGALLDGGWQRGPQPLTYVASDAGAGIRLSETIADGRRVALTEHPCREAMIDGALHAAALRPCAPRRSGVHRLDTASLPDGRHSIRSCAADFARNRSCTETRPLLTDNTAPAAPAGLTVLGGDGWRRVNRFDLAWRNPVRGTGSPVAAAGYRWRGAAGFDGGVHYVQGPEITSLGGLSVPTAGAYTLELWLRDEAGNESPAEAASVTLRFDDVRPEVAFATRRQRHRPELLRATVSDELSGPARGRILYRRLGRDRWRPLPTRLRPVPAGGVELRARFPCDRLAPGQYALRAEAFDLAGNRAATGRRADGRPMVVRAPLRRRAVLHAMLDAGSRQGRRITVPQHSRVALAGVLRTRSGDGLGGRRLQVVIAPERGSRARRRELGLRTGAGGGFRLPLGRGPSRTVWVRFPGSGALRGASAGALRLRVRTAVDLQMTPREAETGREVRFTGRVIAPDVAAPRRGRIVELQYFEAEARRWRPVMLTRTDERGRFACSYRFRYITGLARIMLRAVALAGPGWPYAAGVSRATVLTVRG